jgi:hypothetical protein
MQPVLSQKAIDQRFDVLLSKADMICRAIHSATEFDQPIGIQKLFARATVELRTSHIQAICTDILYCSGTAYQPSVLVPILDLPITSMRKRSSWMRSKCS